MERVCLNTEIGKKIFESRGFNGREERVEQIKDFAANLWTAYVAYCPPGTDSARLMAIAKTDLESSVMFAVKAMTRAEEQI